MAIISKGQVLLSGEPRQAIDALQARVWRKTVSKQALPEYQARGNLLSTRLVGGQPMIHVFSEGQPEEGFVSVEPDLEDVYFQRLRRHDRAAAGAAG